MAAVLLEFVVGYLGSLRNAGAYEAVFLLLFLCGIGMPLSQDMLLLAAAGFVSLGTMALGPLAVVSVLGLLAGDAVTFWTGRHWGARWIRRPWAARYVPPERLASLEGAAHRHGAWASFVTRLLPGQRSTLFFLAGTLRMPWRRFLFGDGIGAIVQVGVMFYGARALGWSWSRLREPFDRVDDVLTGGLLLVIVLIALWTRGASQRAPGRK